MPKRECEILNFTCFDWLPLELDLCLWSQICEDKMMHLGTWCLTGLLDCPCWGGTSILNYASLNSCWLLQLMLLLVENLP